MKISLFLVLFVFACSNVSKTTGPSEIPNMAKPSIDLNIPECIQEAESNALYKKTDIVSYRDIYRFIPQSITFVDNSMKFVQASIDSVFKMPFYSNYEYNSNGFYLKTEKRDSSFLTYYNIITYNKKNDDSLVMSYLTDEDSLFNGSFCYANSDSDVAISIKYDNFGNKEKKINVRYFKGRNINSSGYEPQKIGVNFYEKDSIITVSGVSYLGNLGSLSFDKKVNYSFKTIANVNKNIASAKVALVPDGIDDFDFEDYRADKIFIHDFLSTFNDNIVRNDSLRKAVEWSVANENPLPPENDVIKWLAIYSYNSDLFDEGISESDMTKFFLINKAVLENYKEFELMYSVLEAKQPIYFYKNGMIRGNVFDSIPDYEKYNLDSLHDVKPKVLEEDKIDF